MTPEIAAKIHQIRMMIVRGEETKEAVKEAIALYREARGFVAEATEVKVKKERAPKVKKQAITGDALLDQFIGKGKRDE
jgi:hypothetical protein